MSKLRIGYVPITPDLNHAGDRRRLVYWARRRGHAIVLDKDEKVDVVVLTERADFFTALRNWSGAPVILDLIDGYLGDERVWKDLARGVGKVLTGQISGPPRRYKEMLIHACIDSQAVICETPEQRETILPYCENTHAILSIHEEFPMLNPQQVKSHTLMWEGLPFTAGGLKLLEKAMIEMTSNFSPNLKIVTDLRYPQILGTYRYRDTEKVLGRIPNILGQKFSISEWSLSAVIETAKLSQIAVLPLDPAGKLNSLKAENRLLIMWRLGLPTLTSPSLAYNRVMKAVGMDQICQSPGEWMPKLKELFESQTVRNEAVNRGQQYIRDTHSEKIVLEAWDRAIESVL